MLYKECFSKVGNQIEASGEMYHGEINLNMSSIWTKLIQVAGRYCDYYASDLLIDVKIVESDIDGLKPKTYYFGFHKCGVDHLAFIHNRSLFEIASDYRAIYRLDVEFLEDDYYDCRIKVVLQEVEYLASRHEFLRSMGKECDL